MNDLRNNTTRMGSSAVPLLWVALGVCAVTTVLALIDPWTTGLLAGQVASGYPHYGSAQIGAAVSAYVVILATVGVIGLIGWFVTIRLARRGRGAARWMDAVVSAFILVIALIGLTTPDTSGMIGLAPVFGWLLLIPGLFGAIALVRMRRRTPTFGSA